MRIAVSGAHGLGKTTMVEFISNSFGIVHLGEQARMLINSKYPFCILEKELDTFIKFQKEILDLQEKAETEAVDCYVVDRPFVDSFIYVKERLSRDRPKDPKYETFFHEYRERTKVLMADRYDLIVFIRFNRFSEEDSIRNSNHFYLSVLDDMLELEYRKMGLYSGSKQGFLELTTDILEERKALVTERIKSLKEYGGI